jgi:hypothetical protein
MSGVADKELVMARVQIFNGLLSLPTFQGDLEFVHTHPLRRQDASLVTGSYTGEATWIGERTLVIPGRLDVERVEVLDVTPESKDRADGYFHGRTQKRNVAPKNKSEAFVDGWREGRAER